MKTGIKNLWLYDEGNRNKGLQKCEGTLCVLDFYVDENVQRGGWGRRIFEAMLGDLEGMEGLELEKNAGRLAYDRPSKKMKPFLAKHYGLGNFVDQSNNYVVFQPFWDSR